MKILLRFILPISITVLGFFVVKKSMFVQEEKLQEIAVEAYNYFYPLLTFDTTMRITSYDNTEDPSEKGKINRFIHLREHPKGNFKAVVRPNFDTLYSIAFFDISEEPVIFTYPEIKDKYFLFQFLDAWSEVFFSRSSVNHGTNGSQIAFVKKSWTGTLPEGVERVEVGTDRFWLITRILSDGNDYKFVNAIQDKMEIFPLSNYSSGRSKKPLSIEPVIASMFPSFDSPLSFVDSISVKDYFEMSVKLMNEYAGAEHVNKDMIEKLKKLHIYHGKKYSFDSLPKKVINALEQSKQKALSEMKNCFNKLTIVNNWHVPYSVKLGKYGTNYKWRACVTHFGFGANLNEDSIYFVNDLDSNGDKYNSDNSYILHFDKNELPPARGFWSLTIYDVNSFPFIGKIDRPSLQGGELKYNMDGSLDIYINRNGAPFGKSNANWLPAPHSGSFNLTMRVYPGDEATKSQWAIPSVKKVM